MLFLKSGSFYSLPTLKKFSIGKPMTLRVPWTPESRVLLSISTNSVEVGAFLTEARLLYHHFLSPLWQTLLTLVLFWVVFVFFFFFCHRTLWHHLFMLFHAAYLRIILIISWFSWSHFVSFIRHLLSSIVVWNQSFRIFFDLLPPSWDNILIVFEPSLSFYLNAPSAI